MSLPKDFIPSWVVQVLDFFGPPKLDPLILTYFKLVWLDLGMYNFWIEGSRDLWKEIFCSGEAQVESRNLFNELLVFLEYLALLLQKILQYLLLFGNFVEFPNRHRPKCTTMPWNIWPSLVVLWGVCWMFQSNPIHQADVLDSVLLDEEYLGSFNQGRAPSHTIYLSAKLTSPSQTHHWIFCHPYFHKTVARHRKILIIGCMPRDRSILGRPWGTKPLKIQIRIILDNQIH
jgi:hypothetical protein